MLLKISTTHQPATDLGYLLHKHPARSQTFDLSFGAAHVFYPKATTEQCTAALLLDVDPVQLVRRRTGAGGFGLQRYVNDRPYVASSFLSVALAGVYGTALNGRSKERPQLVETPIPLHARIAVLPQTIAQFAATNPAADSVNCLQMTDYKTVDLADPASVRAATDWWLDLTACGGEGMVLKPFDFVARGPRGLVQPALKCRGREYLRIIYGPEYTAPEHLDRLRRRGLARKRSLALREFALGVEALERFVRREPLRRVHECVFGVLALESEPVDPRL